MKKTTFLLISIFLIFLSFSSQAATLMTIEALNNKLDAITVLDVRTGNDWSGSNFKIKGADRADPKDFGRWSSAYPKNTPIILYCAWPSEFTSAGLAQMLESKGYTNTYALKGGWKAWVDAKLPVEEINE